MIARRGGGLFVAHLFFMGEGILTSPIMTAFSAVQPMSCKACWKNMGSGLPTTSALVSDAYSNADTKGPGPSARPSPRL